MKKLLFALAAGAAMVVAVNAQAADKLKACFVYVGPIGDFGYSYQHEQGRQQQAAGPIEKPRRQPDAGRARPTYCGRFSNQEQQRGRRAQAIRQP